MREKLESLYLHYGVILILAVGVPWYLAIFVWFFAYAIYAVTRPLNIPVLADKDKRSGELSPESSEYQSRYMPKN